ncbi:MAG: hypothetical protein M4D80_20050 [Myxococcota bacterium]|nr:hypothetical protein [Myxococcota bacterium]
MSRVGALVLLAACAGGPEPGDGVECGDGVRADFESCDDGNRIVGDGCSRCVPELLATVYWRFYATIGADPVTECPPGVARIELVTEANTTTSYACDGRRDGTVFIPGGKRVLARLLDASGMGVAESLPRHPSTNGGVNADFYKDGGWVRAWFARDCETSSVVLTLVPSEGGDPIYMANTCGLDPVISITSGVAKAGLYDVTLETNNVERTITGVTVKPNNGVTDVEFR